MSPLLLARLNTASCPCPIPAAVPLLPTKHEALGWRRILFDRQTAFMQMEIVRLRESLMGSDTLIAKVKAKNSLDPAKVLSDVISAKVLQAFESDTHSTDLNSDSSKFEPWLSMKLLIAYVSDASYGDAALRWAGHLPPVAPFAPGQPILECGCDGLFQDGILGNLKATKKPEWSPLFSYIEQHEKSTPQLRLELAKALEVLNDKFIDLMDRQLRRWRFPRQDMMELQDETDFHPLLEKVEPLPHSLAEGLDVAAIDPCGYSMAQLEALRQRGKAVHESIARKRRMQGNDLWTRAKSIAGTPKDDVMVTKRTDKWVWRTAGESPQSQSMLVRPSEALLADAENVWLRTSMYAGFESAASLNNLAALRLKQKKFEDAVMYALGAGKSCDDVLKQPNSYSTYRWSFVMALRTAALPDLPKSAGLSPTLDEQQAINALQ